MKILVTVSEVAELVDGFTVEETRISEGDLEYDLNEWDDYAIETAVQLAESAIADEVVSVTIGPERAEETVRIALAKGVDRAIRVWDDSLEGELLDPGMKSELLSPIVEDEAPDLVLTGAQSGDDNFGATGVTLADEIDYEHAAIVNDLELQDGEDTVSVHRELEGGLEEHTEVELPAVFTIQTGINEPRYASLRGIRQAQRKEIRSQTLDDIGMSASAANSSLTIKEMYEPESESNVTLYEGDPAETANHLTATLEKLGVFDR